MKTVTKTKLLSSLLSFTLVLGILVLSGCSTKLSPLESSELEAYAEHNKSNVIADQTPISGPISLYEAMARALRYNLDYKLELMTEMLAHSESDLTRYDMLPNLVANSAYTARDTFGGASSSRLLSPTTTGDQSLVASTSSEREYLQHDAELSWDILDFGLSYIRSKQKADEVLIAQENRRNVANRIIEDVRSAYWRAVSAERLKHDLLQLEGEISRALDESRFTHKNLRVKPLDALTYQRELLEKHEEVLQLDRDLVIAKKQLAALMNIEPGQDFELELPNRDVEVVQLNVDADTMIDIALNNRPEFREVAYLQRINKRESTAALLELLPSLRLYGGFNYNDNRFLFNNSWAQWGARASWNLLEAFKYPAKKNTREAQDALLHQRGLALTMAVMTQVHVSRTRFEHAKLQVETAKEIYDVQKNILEQIQSGYNAKRVSQHSLIREKMNAIVAEAKYDVALSGLHSAFANVYASMGINAYGSDLAGDESLAEMTSRLGNYWYKQGDRFSTKYQ